MRALLSAAVLTATLTLSASAADLYLGRCHTNECSWFSVEERDLVGTTAADEGLFKVHMKGWVSEHPDGNYAKRTPRHGGEDTVSYFLCSKKRPAVLWQSDPGSRWEVGYLNLRQPSGAEEAAAVEYFVVCHGVSPGSDFDRTGQRFGYQSSDEHTPEQQVADPLDVLR